MTTRVQDERRAAGALHRAALRRVVQPKNREKGSWRGLGLVELVALIRAELDEVEREIGSGGAYDAGRVEEELGDVAAFVAMALDTNGSSCCCIGGSHVAHCPGFFVNEETRAIERCDECATFASDEDVIEFLLVGDGDARELETVAASDVGSLDDVLGKSGT